MDEKSWKNKVKESIKEEANKTYQKEAQEKSKLHSLIKYKNKIEREKYIMILDHKDASAIMKIRTRMSKLRGNYKGSHENPNCQRCKQEDETEEHLIDRSPNVDKQTIDNISYHQILKNELNIEQYKKIIHFISECEEQTTTARDHCNDNQTRTN